MEESNEDKMLILMSSGPDTPRRCASPFYLATAGAAMEYDVEIVFNMDGILLLKKGVAENVYAIEGGQPVSDFMRQAKEVGVKFHCCVPALDLHGLSQDDLIEEVDGIVGGAHVIDAAHEASVVFTF